VQEALLRTARVTAILIAITSLIPLCILLTSERIQKYSSITEPVKHFVGSVMFWTGVVIGMAVCLFMLYDTLVKEKEE